MMSATLTAVPDAPRTAPTGTIGGIAVELLPMRWQGEACWGWRMRAQGLDGTGRLLKARSFKRMIADGQAVAEGWAEDHGLRIMWDVEAEAFAVGFLLPALDGDEDA